MESPSSRTTRNELGRDWLGKVDGVFAISELGGAERASAVWEQSPCLGKALGTVLDWAG